MNQANAEEQTKNIVIEAAISRMNMVVEVLEDFVMRVQEGNVPPKEETDKLSEVPSLMTTLNTAPDKIGSITDRLRKVLEELRNALF